VIGEWKLAHDLTNKFDVLCFETLNLKGMQRLWGRKISDLAFGEFLQILEWIAKKKANNLYLLINGIRLPRLVLIVGTF
jgi:putative transposase